MSEVDPLIGRMLLGRYRVVGRLAQGGMGVVYLARLEGAAGFTKPVVLKRILPDLEQKEMMGMFVREARILGKLRHPNIASILDFSEEDGANVMVLEYVHGYDVGHWRRYVRSARGSFDLEIALYIVVSVLEALAHAHHLVQPDGSITQIVHRDISPSNVLVDTEGHVKLLDFGVARMLGGESGLYKTAEITIKGKIPYVAPELLQGGTPSPQGDVYACAVVLHELLVGRNELRGNDMNDTVLRVFSHVPCPISEVRDDVPPELDAILARQLSKSPEVRLQTANEFASALRSIQKLAPDELRRRLVAQLREDYEAMPAATGVTPLADRERAWRIPTETLIARELDTEPNVGGPPSSLPPTVA
ncbi:MAG: serine/threonine protein kinase, partial [Sandaracinaceae bacterium]|nr:serine/threonine protein kinase [Sandaracinaceae bacterium]